LQISHNPLVLCSQNFNVVAKNILIGLLILIIGNEAAAQCTLRFSGVVTDADTRELLPSATITIRETAKTGKTDAEGRFVIEGLCPGTYNITISHVGCEPLELHLHIHSDIFREIQLPHRHNEMAEVTVSGAAARRNTAVYQELKGAGLEAVRGRSLGEAVQKLPGVTLLQTGNNVYKPVINGMHSNRVLILNNGIRQEGQQWGSEHAPEIDPYIANRIAVVKGAGTLRYGSDAIGGVILVEPRLLPTAPGIAGEINLAGFSNNRQVVASGIIEGNSKKTPAFSWRLQGTLKQGGNARTPDYWLANSGNREQNFSAAMGWNKKKNGVELFYSQFNNKIGLFTGAHIGNVTDLKNAIARGIPDEATRRAEFSYAIDRPYQQVQHHLLKVKAFWNTGDFGRLNWISSGQYNQRSEYDKGRAGLGNDPQLELDLTTLASELVWDHYNWHGLRGTIGVNGSYQYNGYVYRFFIPNYEALNLGAFLSEKINLGKFLVEAGARIDHRGFFNITNNNGNVFDEKNYSSISGNAGVSVDITDALKATLNLSSAWRSPQINELYSDGLHHGAARLERGLPTLNPERANSILANLNWHNDHFQIEASFYHKDIQDFIYLKPVYPPQLTIRGAFPSFAYAQTDARFSGLDVLATWEYDKHLTVSGKASLLRAFDKTLDDWLIQIPADRVEGECTYTFADSRIVREPYLKATVLNVFKQTRFPKSGNIEVAKPDGSSAFESDYAPPPPAYTLCGLEAGAQILWGKQPIHLIAAAQNLFNRRYKDYMDAFRYFTYDRGRDISIRVRIPIGLNQANGHK